jgi:hypothetical protein
VGRATSLTRRSVEPAPASTRGRRCLAAFAPPVALDEPVAVSAARLRASHRSLRLPDAIVLATAGTASTHESGSCWTTGRWRSRIHADLLNRDVLDTGYRLVIAEQ